MNHYPRHVGDYIRDTLALSMLEDGAYNRCLDQYYLTEFPLPTDKAKIYRMVRAFSKMERAAVDVVLREHFTLTPDGYRHKRVDAELAAIYQRSDSARKSAEIRWAAREAKSDANALPNAMRTHSVGNASQDANPMLPITQHPTPKESKAMSDSPKKPANADAPKLTAEQAERRAQAIEVLNLLNRHTGRHYRPENGTLGPIMARLKDGHTLRELRAVVALQARQWKGDPKMDYYLRPKTLFGVDNFANYVGAVPPDQPELTP